MDRRATTIGPLSYVAAQYELQGCSETSRFPKGEFYMRKDDGKTEETAAANFTNQALEAEAQRKIDEIAEEWARAAAEAFPAELQAFLDGGEAGAQQVAVGVKESAETPPDEREVAMASSAEVICAELIETFSREFGDAAAEEFEKVLNAMDADNS